MNESKIGDLGFTFRESKNGDIVINHHGKKAAILRKLKAQTFKESIDSCAFDELQKIMARVTGDYKRGNERLAKNHPRNRGR